MTTFIDTNIIIFLLDENHEHHQWSQEVFNKARESGPVIIPDIAYSELSIGLPDKEATDAAISELALERLRCTDESLFIAGRAYLKYKDENKGTKNMLPDFLIGAQASTEGAPLMTNNKKDFKGYFPGVEIICP